MLCLLCLYGNREYPGSFQNKSVIPTFKRVSKYILFLAKLKGEGKPFCSGQAQINPLKYLLDVGIMLVIIKVFIILFLLYLWEQRTPWQFSKQISKLSLQLFRYILFLAKLMKRRICFVEYDAVTLTMLYFKVLHNMVSQNS